MPADDNKLTWDDLSQFTWGELSDLKWEELNMEINSLVERLKNDNRKLPVATYEKLCALCDEVSDVSGKPVKKPKNNPKEIADMFIYFTQFFQAGIFWLEKLTPIVKELLEKNF